MFTSLLPVTAVDEYLERTEISKVRAGITASVPQCIALVGIPGSGKTSLMRICSGESQPAVQKAFVDLRGSSTLDDQVFSSAIADALGFYGSTVDVALKRATDSHERVALFIDEFDRVSEGVSGDALARLRALIAGRYLGKVAVVTASTRPLYELCEAVRGSAFYNIFRTLPLSTFNRGIFMQWAAKNGLADKADDLWALTGGFPALIVRLLMEGWESAPQVAPLGALDGVASMLNSISSQEMAVLQQCAAGDDTADVVAMSPSETITYLQRSGLIDTSGAVSSRLVAQYTCTRIEAPPESELRQHTAVYVLIRRLETNLKQTVRCAIRDGRIPPDCFKTLLEHRQYERLLERKQRFRFALPDDCDAAHFPELGLVIKKHFGTFSTSIQMKKSEFDRNFEIVAPIRNEEFHFHFIPAVELKRAEVALHDLNDKIAIQ